MARRYLAGETPSQIAQDFGCSRDVIRVRLIQNDVKLRQARVDKACLICGVLLDGSNTTWYRQKNYIYKCNSCMRAEKAIDANEARKRDPGIQAERSHRHKEKLREENPKRYTARQMRSSAKKRAEALGLNYDLDADYIESIFPECCPVLGVEMKYGGGEKCKSSASLDRIIPERGYVKGNVMVISLLANTMKNEASPNELKEFARWILKTYDSSVGDT